MTIGIELGWQAVRVVTTSEQEILSVGDADNPATVVTAPVVARAANGALVGPLAIDITGDDRAGGALTIKHAYPASDTDELPLLLEKLARDLRAVGQPTRNVIFVVSDELVKRTDAANNPDLARLRAAADQAGFSDVRVAHRAEAAAIQGWAMPWPVKVDVADTACVLVVDIGVRGLRLTVVDLELSGNQPRRVFPDNITTAATDVATWIGQVPPDRSLEFSLFGHLARLVSDRVGDTLSPAGLDHLWRQLRDPDTSDNVAIIDSQNRRLTFDIVGARQQLLDDIADAVGALLANGRLTRLDQVKLVVVTGQFAQLENVEQAVRDGVARGVAAGAPIAQPAAVQYRTLPAHALASAARYAPLLPVIDVKLGDDDAPPSALPLRFFPINDGELDPDDDASDDPKSWGEPADTTGPLNDVLELRPGLKNDTGRISYDIGREVGQYWVAKTDRLLRLQATAPTVPLKTIYDKHIRDNDIGVTDIDGKADAATASISPKAQEQIAKALQPHANDDEAKGTLLKGVIDGYNAARQTGAVNLAYDYAEDERKRVLPTKENDPKSERIKLALVVPAGDSSPVSAMGILPTAPVVVTDASITDTQSTDKAAARLGYSPDGFRQLLATERRRAPPKGPDATWHWLMGGEVRDREKAGLVALGAGSLIASLVLGVAAIFPSLPSTLFPPKSVVVRAVANDGLDGTLSCTTPSEDKTTMSCSISGDETSRLVASGLPKGCYVALLRVLVPQSEDIKNIKTSTVDFSMPPLLDNAQCREGFDVHTVLWDIGQVADRPPAAPTKDGDPTPSDVTFTFPVDGDGKRIKANTYGPEWRYATISDKNGSVKMTDVIWVGHTDGEVSVPLPGLWNFTVPGTNEGRLPQLCAALPLQLYALPLDEAAKEPAHLLAILDQRPTGLGTLRLYLAPEPHAMVPVTFMGALPAAGADGLVPPTPEGAKVDISPGMLWGLNPRPERLIGNCPPPA